MTNEQTGNLFNWQENGTRTEVKLPAIAQGDPAGNRSLEGMTFTPSGNLWIGTERNKLGDGARLTRLSQLDSQGNVLKQLAYRLDDLSSKGGKLDTENGVSEILAVDDQTLLVMERAWDGTSATANPQGTSHNSIRIYRVDLSTGQDVKDNLGLSSETTSLPKTLVFDSASLSGVLNTYDTKIDNVEGMTFGPRLPNGHASLVLVSDNNNSRSQGKTQFIVFAVDSSVPNIQFWDGDGQHMADGVVGGDGVWRADKALENWSREGGWVNDAWGNNQAVFAGAPGTVIIDARNGGISTDALDFRSDGYVLKGDALTLTAPQTPVSVTERSTATINVPLSGTGGLSKTGKGDLVLTGASNYKGATRVEGGTLQVDGSLSSAVSVANGARLSGQGKIGAASIETGGEIDPAGHAIGVLTVDGTLALAAGAKLTIDFNASQADRVKANTIELSGSEVVLRAGAGASPNRGDFQPASRYQILEASDRLNGNLSDQIKEDFAYLTPKLSYDSNTVWLSFERTSTVDAKPYTLSLVEQYNALRRDHPEIAGPLYSTFKEGFVSNSPVRNDHNMDVVRGYRTDHVSQARKDLALADGTNYNMQGMTARARGNLDTWPFGGIGGEHNNPFMNMGPDSPAALHRDGKALSNSPRPINVPVDKGGVTTIGNTGSSSSSFPSGHTANGTGANLLAAYIYPERFQAFVNRAQEYGESRVVLGVHYPLDVMASRAMTYKAVADQLAKQVSDPNSWLNATAKPTAIRQAQLDRCQRGGFASISACASGPSGDHTFDVESQEQYQKQLDYYNYTKDYGFDAFLKARNITLGAADLPMQVPENAEYLIASRYPYLDRQQLREILRTTADPSGRVLDDPWSRINLFRAAEGYGRFDQDVTVNMQTAKAKDNSTPGAHFSAEDRWRNNIGGSGKLTKQGDGVLTLGGDNSFGGLSLQGGALIFTRSNALSGDIHASAGELRVEEGATLRTGGNFTLDAGATLRLNGATIGADQAMLFQGNSILAGRNILDVAATGSARIAGRLSGAGALDKQGAGGLVLQGDSGAYQGNLAISAGMLQLSNEAKLGGVITVAKDARLLGTGAANNVQVNAGGFLAPGGDEFGAMLANDVAFADGAFYAISVNALGQSSSLHANGQVSIGNNVDVFVSPLSQSEDGSTYQVSTRYTILSADQGIAGTFNAVRENFAFLDAHLAHQGNTVYLTLQRTGGGDGGGGGGEDDGGGGGEDDGGSGGGGGEPLVLTPASGPKIIASAADLGNAPLRFEGGVLGTTGSMQLSNAITLASMGGTVETAGNTDLTFGGKITGAGGLTKAGRGSLTLASDNDYAGETQVTAGRLAVNGSVLGHITVDQGAILGGRGRIGSAKVLGHLAPGNSIGTLSVSGPLTFASGSIYDVEVNAQGTSDRTDVGGAVTIGDNVQVAVSPENRSEDGSTYRATTRYQILDAKGGINGQFAGVTDSFALLDAKLDQQSNDVALVLTKREQLHFADVVNTPNQKAVATAVESLGDGNSLFDSVLYLPDGAPSGAFDQLSGELHPAVASVLVEQSGRVRRALGQRLRNTKQQVERLLPGHFASLQPIAQDDPLEAWVEVLGGHADYDGDGNGHDLTLSDGRGVLAGVDGDVATTWRVGVAAGYNRAKISVGGMDALASTDSYHFGAYAGTERGLFNFNLGALYNSHHIDSERRIVIPRFSDHLTANSSAHTTQVFAEAAMDLAMGQIHWQPYMGLAWIDFEGDDFQEHGGSAALRGSGVRQHRTFGTVGLRASSAFKFGATPGALSLGAGLQHGFNSSQVTQTLAFAEGQPFQVSSTTLDQNSVGLEAQASLDLSPRSRLTLSYDGNLASDRRDQSLNAELSVSF
ncbi:hypothetical protein XB05_19045 [Xanthomonas arboricola]|nr:hypothetical protein XB05_19045 [Xanthomonas arboricola]